MNNVVNLFSQETDQITMSSREIAELTGKRHDHVKRDIRSMYESLGLPPNFGEKVEETGGRPLVTYHLDRYHTEVLVTGYDVRRRAAVIKRWYDLESGKAQPLATQLPDFTNPAESARAWAEQFERAETLQLESQQARKKIEEDAPKVEFYSAVADTEGLFQLSEVVKALQLDFGRNTAFAMLRKSKVLLKGKQVRNNPAQSYVNRGLLKLKQIKHVGGMYTTTMVTGKGVIWLYNYFESDADIMDVKEALGMETGES